MSHKKIQRLNTIEEIKSHARKHMEKSGLAGISMSAISRSMEISAPALYRYFDSRDDLIEALFADALVDFADSLEKAACSLPPDEFARRFWLAAMEYRDWALAHPTNFQLIFDYPGSDDLTGGRQARPRPQRIFQVFAQILWDAYRDGRLRPLPAGTQSPDVADFRSWSLGEAADIPVSVMVTGLVAWSRIHGLVALELAQRKPDQANSLKAIYRQEVDALIKNIGLEENQLPTQPDEQQIQLALQQAKLKDADNLKSVVDTTRFERIFRITATSLTEAVRKTVAWFRDSHK